MTNMLIMTACQFSNPMPFFIIMISNDWLFHAAQTLTLAVSIVSRMSGIQKSWLHLLNLIHDE